MKSSQHPHDTGSGTSRLPDSVGNMYSINGLGDIPREVRSSFVDMVTWRRKGGIHDLSQWPPMVKEEDLFFIQNPWELLDFFLHL